MESAAQSSRRDTRLVGSTKPQSHRANPAWHTNGRARVAPVGPSHDILGGMRRAESSQRGLFPVGESPAETMLSSLRTVKSTPGSDARPCGEPSPPRQNVYRQRSRAPCVRPSSAKVCCLQHSSVEGHIEASRCISCSAKHALRGSTLLTNIIPKTTPDRPANKLSETPISYLP